VTATIPAHAEVRDCRLYRFRVYHPDDMRLPPEQRRIVLGYVGETVRMPIARLIEHLYDQPWADTIVGWDVDPRIFAGKTAVLEAERRAIEQEQPLYNVEHNRGNPHRISPPVAIRQRRARDAANVSPNWVHPDDRGGPTRAPAPARMRPPVRRRWSSRRKHLTGIVVAWLVLAGASWIGLAVYRLVEPWQNQAVTAPVGSLVLTVWVWAGCPVTRRQRRRAWSRIRKRLRSRP
jgi:hypothetical protein